MRIVEQNSLCCFLQAELQTLTGSCSAANMVLLTMNFWYPSIGYLVEPLASVSGLQWQNYAAYGECAVVSVGAPGDTKEHDVVAGSMKTCGFGGVHGLAAAVSYSAAAVVQHMIGEGEVESDVWHASADCEAADDKLVVGVVVDLKIGKYLSSDLGCPTLDCCHYRKDH